ncbi:MAG: ribosomal protein S18-alanine N-acetyltransferase [Bacteroides sp.]|nr:ribosomal protein S18-alanine N-acetyltransferase [Bacteroides sp.]
MDNTTAAVIAEMEKQCFPFEPWSLESVKAALQRDDTLCKVLFDEADRPVGYFIAASSFEEAELYRIAVLPSLRRKGLGERLMRDFLNVCPKETERIFLEVRESNAAAIGLYEKSGFKMINRRKNYYGSEDGLIFCLERICK